MFGFEVVWHFIFTLGFIGVGVGSLTGVLLTLNNEKNIFEQYKKIYPFILLSALAMLIGWGSFSVLAPEISMAFSGVKMNVMRHSLIILHQARLIPVFLIAFFTLFAGGLFRKEKNISIIEIIYFVNFILVFVVILLPLIILKNSEGLFLSLKDLSLFLTLGTILFVSYLFILAKKNSELRMLVQKNVVNFAYIVFFGVGVDFINSLLVLNDSLKNDKIFYFSQSIVGFSILIGVLLIVPAGYHLRLKVDTEKWSRVLMTGGSIWLSSWLFLSVLNIFEVVSWRLSDLFLAYALFNLIVWVSLYTYKKI